MQPWAGLFALGLQSPHLLNGGSSCLSILQAGWARTVPEGQGVRAGGQFWGAKGGCHPRLREMGLDSGETRQQVIKCAYQ